MNAMALVVTDTLLQISMGTASDTLQCQTYCRSCQVQQQCISSDNDPRHIIRSSYVICERAGA